MSRAVHRVGFRNRACGWLFPAALAASLMIPLLPARAQSLRLGPFDFTATAPFGFVWSDNIEQERPSEATGEMRDYYVFAGLDLASTADLSGGGSLTIDTGFTLEKHFVRDDLDNSENPWGRFRAELQKPLGQLDANAYYDWQRTSESAEDLVIPGVSRKTRNPMESEEYGWGLLWEDKTPVSLGFDYSFLSERYDKEEFKVGDVDTTTLNYFARWQALEKTGFEYKVEKTKDEFVQNPGNDVGWQTTETILVDHESLLIRRPEVVFTFGLEKEDDMGKEGEWDPIYGLRASDEWDLTSRLKLTFNADLTYEATPESSDTGSTWDLSLEHLINSQARQSFGYTREPQRTFGLYADTDVTTLSYNLTVNDVLIPDLSFLFDYSYEIDEPVEGAGETEKITTYTLTLEHVQMVSPKLQRTLSYTHDVEDSNLENEFLIENRIELKYDYLF